MINPRPFPPNLSPRSLTALALGPVLPLDALVIERDVGVGEHPPDGLGGSAGVEVDEGEVWHLCRLGK